MTNEADPPGSGIHKRFRDLSVDVREERVIRYVVRQLELGRGVDEIMDDPYVHEHADEVARAKALQHPKVLKAIEDQIRHQFADYSSTTGPGGETPESD